VFLSTVPCPWLTQPNRLSMSSITSISNVTRVSIISDHDLDCSPAISAWERSNHSIESYLFTCEGPKHPKKRKTPLGLGLGLGIGLPALAAIGYCIYLCKKRTSQKPKLKDTPPEYDLGGTYKYSPAAGGGSAQGSKTVADTHAIDASSNASEE